MHASGAGKLRRFRCDASAAVASSSTMDECWAEVVLVSGEGALLGKLPPVLTERPWWQEAGAVVRAVRQAHGVHVTVLRLLRAERECPPGGRVTYLAEVAGPVSCEPCQEALSDHPLRRSYARPGGPRRDLAWASSVLAARGLTPVGAPEQIKSWNLSSVWRIPLSQGSAWLKVVPPFFAHEGALIAALEPHGGVPQVLGFERGRALLAEIDWGDAGIGHPLLDEAAFLERVPPEQRGPLRDHFHAAWQRALPSCDPARAEQLIAPIAAARQAVIYDKFLDQIEPSEHPYHQQHPLRWLVRAAQACR